MDDDRKKQQSRPQRHGKRIYDVRAGRYSTEPQIGRIYIESNKYSMKEHKNENNSEWSRFIKWTIRD